MHPLQFAPPRDATCELSLQSLLEQTRRLGSPESYAALSDAAAAAVREYEVVTQHIELKWLPMLERFTEHGLEEADGLRAEHSNILTLLREARTAAERADRSGVERALMLAQLVLESHVRRERGAAAADSRRTYVPTGIGGHPWESVSFAPQAAH